MPSDLLDDGILEADDCGVEAAELCFSPPPASSLDKYYDEWERLRSERREGLAERAVRGELRTARHRSVAWRLLLGVLSDCGGEGWVDQTQSLRRGYRQLKARLTVDPRLPLTPPSLDNPLSQHTQSSWHQFFCDGELRCVIMQDVRRTFPGLDFFRSPHIQDLMVDILFCYARQNPLMCYRQGMHEILAPVLFVLSCDHQALLHLQQQTELRSDILELLNPECLEEDGYCLFERIMESVESCYHVSDVVPLATGHFPTNINPCSMGENQVIGQLKWIKDKILSPTDPQLCQHLENLDISLPLFAIRWLRLLFGREFPLEDLLVMWDSIFAVDSSFDLVNYLVVSMLQAIRTSLLMSDYTSCLSLLMRYPATVDISYIVDYALHLKNPQKYSRPKSCGSARVRPSPRIQEQRPPALRSTVPASRPLLSSSLPAPVEDRNIVEGYSLTDPVVLKGELENYRRLMSLCRLKMDEYLSVIEPALSVENQSVQQALGGLRQLSSLLDAAAHPLVPAPAPVEVAAEAGLSQPPSPRTTSAQAPTRSPSALKRPPSVDMTVFKQLTLSSPAPDLPRDYPATLSPDSS